MTMIDLRTTYLGLPLKNPLVVSASPLSKKVDRIRRAEEAGAAAIVMHSLFEEQIVYEQHQLDYYLSRDTGKHVEALSYFPDLQFSNLGPEPYLEQLSRIKQAVDIPVIGSLNGVSSGGWVEYAHKIEQAGADALELNIYNLPIDLDRTSSDIEQVYLDLMRDIKEQITIPVALKLSPFFTSLPNIARRFVDAGADGLVLFNRFYQPDFDLETLEVVPNLTLSTSHDLRLPLRWIALLSGRIEADFALSSGVHCAEDALKAVMAGASVAMMTSELIQRGVERLATIVNDMSTWMETHEYESIAQMKGSMSQLAVADPAAFERANYAQALQSYNDRLP
jgi:dihydroorotate dehydrogenase (fumarate)